jgi:DNA mismatch repair protein MutL
MTAKVRIIPDTLSNKIAAGEVVQRPASVVKELIENAIDASADEIVVEVVRAGKGLIRVTDNGTGMTRDDALLSIERFATSKLKSEDDLFNIKTLGFRGEALPSIASVSRFFITTKTEGEVEGTNLYIEGGKLKNVKSAGTPRGTSIEVKNLFYNTPARLKFMKSNSAELFHITDTVVKIAASRHDLHIKLVSDGRVIVDFTKTNDIYNRVCDIFQSDVYDNLVRIDEKNNDIHVFGFVTNPVYTTKNTKKFFTYVNGRYIFDKIVNFAINSAYRSKIEERRYPAVVLFINMPHGDVDVNVHPTKKDVRFRNQNAVIGYIQSAIKNALSSADLIGLGSSRPVESEGQVGGDYPSEQPYRGAVPDDTVRESMKEYMENVLKEKGRSGRTRPSYKKDFPAPVDYSYEDVKRETRDPAQGEMYSDYIKILGQVGASFILCTRGDALLLIDQHAAHERILFDNLTRRYEEKKVSPQPLLIPIIFEVSKSDGLVLESYLDEFSEIGFLIEPFGKNSYAVKEVPDILLGYDYKEIIHDLISDLMFLNKSGDIMEKVSGLIKLLSCKGAIKANKRLTDTEIIKLLRDMANTDFPTNCPHGRPVVIELTQKEIRKMFKRL